MVDNNTIKELEKIGRDIVFEGIMGRFPNSRVYEFKDRFSPYDLEWHYQGKVFNIEVKVRDNSSTAYGGYTLLEKKKYDKLISEEIGIPIYAVYFRGDNKLLFFNLKKITPKVVERECNICTAEGDKKKTKKEVIMIHYSKGHSL